MATKKKQPATGKKVKIPTSPMKSSNRSGETIGKDERKQKAYITKSKVNTSAIPKGGSDKWPTQRKKG